MEITVLNDNESHFEKHPAIEFKKNINNLNYHKLVVSSDVANKISQWAIHFIIDEKKYTSSSAQQDLQNPNKDNNREVRLSNF